ncbi:MAG: AAA family ATPase [Aggregatilineales bacterium]
MRYSSLMNDFTKPPELIDDEASPVFFAGRDVIYARLNQSLMNQITDHAFVITGRDGMGKSTLLRRFQQIFGQTMPGFYLSLTELSFDDEYGLLKILYEHTSGILEAYGFTPRRLPPLPKVDEETSSEQTLQAMRDWLRDTYVAELMYIIRPQRRLVWLLDDAEVLFAALDDGRLTSESIQYLYSLCAAHSQFAMILGLNLDMEHRLNALVPLVNPADVLRPGAFTLEESIALLRQVSPLFTDRAIEMIHQQSGGHPRLLQRFCQVLSEHPMANLSSDSLDEVIDTVYSQSQDEFKQDWQTLNRDERLVMTAVSSLLYRQPERLLSVEMIGTWLEKHDYALRDISVLAALRGLEYRAMLSNQESGIGLDNGMLTL